MQRSESFVLSVCCDLIGSPCLAGLILGQTRAALFAGMLVVSPSERLHSLHLEHFSLMTFSNFFSPKLP